MNNLKKRWCVLTIVVLLSGCGPPAMTPGKYSAALLTAVKQNVPDQINRLLDRGADYLKPSTINGFTPLHLAAIDDASVPINLILRKAKRDNILNGALNARDQMGCTPLMWAAGEGIPEPFYSFEKWSDPQSSERNRQYGTPLCGYLAKKSSHTMIRLLLQYGAKPGITNKDGHTAAALARIMKRRDVLPLLEKRGNQQ